MKIEIGTDEREIMKDGEDIIPTESAVDYVKVKMREREITTN